MYQLSSEWRIKQKSYEILKKYKTSENPDNFHVFSLNIMLGLFS